MSRRNQLVISASGVWRLESKKYVKNTDHFGLTHSGRLVRTRCSANQESADGHSVDPYSPGRRRGRGTPRPFLMDRGVVKVKSTLRYVTALAALAGIGLFDSQASAQNPAPGTPPVSQPQPTRPRIALVNIAKVLREFNKANADGQAITKKRQYYVDQVKPLREKLAALSKAIQATQIPAEKERLQKEALNVNRMIEDLDAEAQRVLGEMTDKTIVDVYSSIKTTINDIAVANNLDLVMCYPDASNPEDEKKPAIAQIKLQTPALIPFYHRGMDISDVVVKTLNLRHPAPAITPVGGMGTPKGP
jgi:Skp family chaperone for outer membrane proteins